MSTLLFSGELLNCNYELNMYYFCDLVYLHRHLEPYCPLELRFDYRHGNREDEEDFLFVTNTIIQNITSSVICAAFNPSKVHTHTHTVSSGQPMLRHPGSSWGSGALLKGLTSVVVIRLERALVIHSPHRQFLLDSNPQPRVTSPTLYPLDHDYP